MPVRNLPLATGEIYHILNRGNAAIPIFKVPRDYWRFIDTFLYYQHENILVKFSNFIKLKKDVRARYWSEIKQKSKRVGIIAFCLMPNHFHFLLRQTAEGGICGFVHQVVNSYSHHFNLKNDRKGSLFEGRFKSIRVETEAQLLHLSRYIHLNPYSSFIVKDLSQLLTYPYSSLPEYLGATDEEVFEKDFVLNHFQDKNGYKKFVLDRADYQKNLETIKHQLLEK